MPLGKVRTRDILSKGVKYASVVATVEVDYVTRKPEQVASFVPEKEAPFNFLPKYSGRRRKRRSLSVP